MLVKTKEQYNKIIQKLLDTEDIIGCDTETEQFSDEKFLSMDLALEGVSVYTKETKAYITPKFLDKKFQEVLDTKELVFHNAKFDLTVFQYFGFNIEKIRYHDSMLMAYLVNENRNSFKLKDLAKTVLKVKEENITRYGDVGGRPKREDFGMFAEVSYYDKKLKEWEKKIGDYAIDDSKYTYKLFYFFRPKLIEQGLWKAYIEMELPFVRVLMDMENKGITLDQKYLKELGNKLVEKLKETTTEVYGLAGRKIDIDSPKQLRELLFGEMKLVLPEEYRTPKGELSTNVEALKYLAENKEIPIAKKIMEYREVMKLHSTYVKGIFSLLREGKIHTNFRQTGTKTGRLSSSKPNLQQIPRRDDEFNIRKAFVPREGYKFVNADYSQIEVRLMAYFSKDPKMLGIYDRNEDIYQATADDLGCTRFTAKSVILGLNYGRTEYGLARGLGISTEEAKKYIDDYFKEFPKVFYFIEQAKNTLKNNYAVWTITKRKRRFPDYAGARKKRDWATVRGMERQATNSIIQGSAADILAIAMRNIYRRLKKEKLNGYLLLTIHDEVLLEVEAEQAEMVSEIVKYEMENAVDLKTVKLITEPTITDCWQK